ncbi:MBOAT family O-acyltransferase [Argonema galeatum]|uniref:MBOAT family O-acyltransferase n=1 Tax=Argonema galeatum TaxID=2942762 RepID=UPI002012EF2B|nr:MBOAT family O-acyltransferase [Argonema galeatum]MCL1465907.1 MBOAT family protein [Argonema galeatum A003/A1]
MTLAIAVNLALIGYFKYANFFADSVNHLIGTAFRLDPIVLPLAISFFTFVQITYLVDAYRGETKEDNFFNYCLFVTFFPHLIAGPIVHHKDLMPQFADKSIYRFKGEYLAVGLTIFFMGLFKKVVFADRIAVYATPVFDAASQGLPLTFFEAWAGVLAYTLQLYFDFSGYSDMAIGASYLFGIKLPLNFDSPYKAVNIIDFWRRWHITLSNFLREYLYIPLGGNRKGNFRRYLNLMITMLLGGLWHGAGWTFIFWGGLHGIYLVINHQWRSFRRWLGHDLNKSHWFTQGISWFVTFLAVIVSWVFFRAKTLDAATGILGAMTGANGISLPKALLTKLGFMENFGIIRFDGITNSTDLPIDYTIFAITFLLFIAWCTPNTQQWMGKYNPITIKQPVINPSSNWSDRFWHKLQWQPNQLWAVASAFLTVISVLSLSRVSEFLYFQF